MIRTALPRRRKKPRRGRVHDRAFLDWLHEERRCAVHGVGRCGPYTVHHLRHCGSPKDDRRTLGLCAALHLHDFGAHSIERLGKAGFSEYWGVDIEAEIQRYNEDYAHELEVSAGFAPTTSRV